MKKLIVLGLFAMALVSCKNEVKEEAPYIPKPTVEVIEGKFTPEIMNLLGRVSDPKVSPSGDKILYGVSYTDIALNKSQRQLFVMNLDGSNNRQITSFPKSSNNARWYDNSNIVFLRGGELYIMNIEGGGKEQKISGVEGDISSFEFSPDGKKILFVQEFKAVKEAADIYPDLPKASGRYITDLMYRHWDCFVSTIPHSYIADFSTKAVSGVVDILDGAPFELPTLPFGGLEQLSWSPDGKEIAYSCRKLVGKEYAFSTNTDIYLYNVESRESKNLTEGMMGYDTDPVFSPDGKYIAWISMERGGFEADKQRLFILDMATGVKKELSANYKYNMTSPTWKPSGDGLYFCSLVNALDALFQVDLEGNVSRITSPDAWFDFDGGLQVVGDKLITTYKSMSQPNEIVSVSIADGSFTQLTSENEQILSQLKKESCEQRWITTTDNKKMHTWVIYPPDFDKTKKYPAILFCTGGPQGTLSQSWSYRWNFKLMAAQGYIVILPNRRGTTAFGQEWCDQISGDYCGQNMQDYLSAAKELLKEPYVGKMGVSGASYGGYSVYYLAGIHKGLFSAFVSHAGIFNQEQMYMMTEELWFPKWDNGGAPWDNNPIAKRHYENSPHKLIKNWNTPILITHGEMDYRVPVEQGMAAFNAAQMMGVPSEMLLFPEENHWILRPQNSIQWHRVYFEWFDKWLK